MKKVLSLILAVILCLILPACGEKEPVDYTDDILGIWYAVEYESEYVEFFDDGTVADTFGAETTYGQYFVDNENALLWVNFGDDVFSIRIAEKDGRLILLDNNGTLVREADRDAARQAYRESMENRDRS